MEAAQAILDLLGVPDAPLLGHGGEAWVFALSEDRVVRIDREPRDPTEVRRRLALVQALQSATAPFGLPEVFECGRIHDHDYTIERRLDGRPVHDELDRLDPADRSTLIEAHLDAAAAIGDLPFPEPGFFGDLLHPASVQAPTWSGYLQARIERSLNDAPGFERVDAQAIARELPAVEAGSFVHLDAFCGNMLALGTTITAVIDVGPTSLWGDRRFDPLSAAIYFCAPEITPTVTDQDRDVARSWLRTAKLNDLVEPTRRWLAAYWSWAVDDAALQSWCRRILLH